MEEKILSEKGKEVSSEILDNFTEAEKVKKDVMSSGFSWDDREAMFYGRYTNKDEKSKENIESYYSTGELTSLILDSACRIMAQMPTGRFTGFKESDIAKVIGANLVYHEYILPNANSGGDFFTKLRQVNVYSKMYGTMPVFIDYVVGKKYTGPDMVMVHPRRCYPQPGKYSINDMDYFFVDVFVSEKWLEKRCENNPKVWDKELIKEIKPSQIDQTLLTSEEKKQIQNHNQIILRNVFNSNGDWLIYEANSKKVILSEKDYFPGIPMVEKLTIPVLDRFWCLSDMERGETPQKSIDSLARKYFASLDKSIDPTAIIDPELMVMSSVNVENKFWFAKDGNVDKVRILENSPQGLATFQSTYNIMKANLMSLSASSDTSVPSGVDVGFGRTPQALKMQGEREGARDSWDRYMQEKFIERVADMMMAVASKRGMADVEIPSIKEALQNIKNTYPENNLDIFKNGIVPKELMDDLSIKYQVDPGSTTKRGDAAAKMMDLLNMIGKSKEIQASIAESGKKINWGEAVKRMAIENGVQDWDKIVVSAENPDSVAQVGDAGGTMVMPEEQAQMEIADENNPEQQGLSY